MISDAERREVARRLRHARTAHEIGEAVGVNCHGGLCNGCASEAAQLLADLIEPSEPEVRCVAEVKVDGERLEELTGIDRDALLELVKELELGAQCVGGRKWYNAECASMGKHLADDYDMIARRIRKALGMMDE